MTQAVLALEVQEDTIAAKAMDSHEARLRREMDGLGRKLRNAERLALAARDELVATAEQEGGDSPASLTLISKVEDLEEDVRDWQWAIYRIVADAAGGRYTSKDIHDWCSRAVEMGASHPRLGKSIVCDLIRYRKVPNAAFRARVLELTSGDGISLKEVLRRFEARLGAPCDLIYMLRLLGLKPQNDGRPGVYTVRLFISYEHAVAFALALDMTPLEAGV